MRKMDLLTQTIHFVSNIVFFVISFNNLAKLDSAVVLTKPNCYGQWNKNNNKIGKKIGVYQTPVGLWSRPKMQT